jgi:indolepyruvate ferredoxin oxidoreductase beta subunit
MEAGRAVQRGLVTPDRTTLVASTHRVYSIAEKSAMGDGRVSSDALLAHAAAAAKRFVRFDMAALAEQNGSVIGAVLFGALAGTGVLPFNRRQFEATIERSGVGVKSSLAAFGAAFDQVQGGAVDVPPAARVPLHGDVVAQPAAAALDGGVEAAPAGGDEVLRFTQDDTPGHPERSVRHPERSEGSPRGNLHPAVRALLDRIESAFPASSAPLLKEGVRRLIDYQDPTYADLYLERLAKIAALAPTEPMLLEETARHLALWMTYEDTARVAALKTRGTRFERVRSEVRAGRDQVLAIDEYLHPGVREIAETLPAGIGRAIERPGWLRRRVERWTRKGRVVTTSSLGGFLMMYAVAGMKRWRRSTTRYAAENAAIEGWLARIAQTAASHPALAVEIARCQRLVKGYSETHARGVRNYETVMAALQKAGPALPPATLQELREAALADEQGTQLAATLARHALV